MARTVTVTKKEVVQTGPQRYTITLNLQYKEDGTEAVLFEKDYPQEYLYGEAPSIYVVAWKAAMQADITKYKAQEAIFNNALLTTAVGNIQAGLVV